MKGVPNDESPCHTQHGCNHPFDFKRLGIRVTSFLISPWIPKNTVIRTPAGPEPTSQYDLTSGIATAKVLFNLSTFLTKRDRWAGTFESLLTLDKPRTDCPMHVRCVLRVILAFADRYLRCLATKRIALVCVHVHSFRDHHQWQHRGRVLAVITMPQKRSGGLRRPRRTASRMPSIALRRHKPVRALGLSR